MREGSRRWRRRPERSEGGREGWQTGTKEGDRGPLRSVGGEGEGQGFRVANGMGREKGTRVN